jgi:hypothetical protein
LYDRACKLLFGIIEDTKFVVDKLYEWSKENSKPVAIEK